MNTPQRRRAERDRAEDSPPRMELQCLSCSQPFSGSVRRVVCSACVRKRIPRLSSWIPDGPGLPDPDEIAVTASALRIPSSKTMAEAGIHRRMLGRVAQLLDDMNAELYRLRQMAPEGTVVAPDFLHDFRRDEHNPAEDLSGPPPEWVSGFYGSASPNLPRNRRKDDPK